LDKLLRESGVDFEKVNYFTEPLGEAKLRELLGKLGLSPRELLRKNEAAYGELGLGRADVTDEEIIRALVGRPELLQRPIVERGPRAVLARPPELARALL
jgi:arsenate reductase